MKNATTLPFDLDSHRLAVCLGPGGVGKTTLSAAIAVGAAVRGRAVDVMTVDPAPRLLDALGLDPSEPGPHAVALDELGVDPSGRLSAMRLDPKRTFDSLIMRYAASEEARRAILDNRIYRNLSNALAGVAQYMAMERLLELHQEPRTDLIVLDTPPAHEGLDFLDAPRRLLEMLDSRAVSILGASRSLIRGGLSLVDLAAGAVLSAFDRLTGIHLLADVKAFVQNFDGMYDGFAQRARQVQELLRSEQCAVIMITGANEEGASQTRSFVESLTSARLPISALIVNRIMDGLPAASSLDKHRLAPALRQKLELNLVDFAALKERESVSLDVLRACLPPGTAIASAPHLGREPRSIRDLAELAAALAAA